MLENHYFSASFLDGATFDTELRALPSSVFQIGGQGPLHHNSLTLHVGRFWARVANVGLVEDSDEEKSEWMCGFISLRVISGSEGSGA